MYLNTARNCFLFIVCFVNLANSDCGCGSNSFDRDSAESHKCHSKKTDIDNGHCDLKLGCSGHGKEESIGERADFDDDRNSFYESMRDDHYEGLGCDSPKLKENANQDFLKHLDEIVSNKYGTVDMVLVEGGTFEMGSTDSRYPADREGPVRNVSVKPFYIDKYAVSNRKFGEYVRESDYVTDAVRFGNSFVFDMLMPESERDIHPDLRAVQAPWWIKLDGATWDRPEGPDSDVTDRPNHPAVHVSWSDANSYCKYHNKRLPTEEEWEMACRGGLRQKLFPWGNDFNAKNMHRANIWHGNFPRENTIDDGYLGTSPVDAFPPNNYGLYNMVGNVWEWTSSKADSSPERDRIKKGGSFMCHKSYCYRYRCAARSFNSIDSTSSNMGFRCAMDSYDKTNIGSL